MRATRFRGLNTLLMIGLLSALPAAAAPPGDGTPEICDNNVDDDGDRKVDCEDRDCRDDPACAGGGGDGGGGTEGIRYDWEFLPDTGGCVDVAWSISEDRDYAGGQTDAPGDCGGCSGAVVWRRDAAAGWVASYLPGVEGGNAVDGDAYAVIDGGTAVGSDVVFGAGCETLRNAPVFWEPIGLDVWQAIELPTPEGWGIARDLVDSPTLGLVAVGQANAAALWRQEAGAWVHVDLGFGGGDAARARGVNEAGVVVGQTRLVAGGDYHAFMIEPLDGDGDGVPDTWFQDADGDGANDLMEILSGGASFYGARDVNDSGTIAGDASDGASVWDATTRARTLLPAGDFTEETRAADLNDASQVVGMGAVSGKRGNPDQKGALWELEAGSWVVHDLNAITDLGRDDEIDLADAINDCGDIVGRGRSKEGRTTTAGAVLLTPRSSPCD